MITKYLGQKWRVMEFLIDYSKNGLHIKLREKELKKKIKAGFKPIGINWIGTTKHYLLEKEL